MRLIILLFTITLSSSVFAKEWKSLKQFQKETQKEKLSSSDWLKKDRLRNTITWQNANHYNLNNKLSKEYLNIVQRRDFYSWLYLELTKKGHEIVWVKMAHFISKKMHLVEVFPYSLLSKKAIKHYTKAGSDTVFNNAFIELYKLYIYQDILKGDEANLWDKKILKKEQYFWIDSIYKSIDTKSLKTLERIVKGKFIYGLALPKSIRFKGELTSAKSRYNYALEMLRPYCQNRYKS